MLRSTAFAAFSLASLAGWAPCPARAQDGALTFTLPTLDGTRFVQAAAITDPVLVNFWGKDCAPCLAELPRLHDFAKANPRWTVLLVSTDSPAEAQAFVQRHGVQLTVLRPGANVAGLMRSAGNRAGALPFSVGIVSSRICGRHLGELQPADFAALAGQCR